jgi:hypothetical protein
MHEGRRKVNKALKNIKYNKIKTRRSYCFLNQDETTAKVAAERPKPSSTVDIQTLLSGAAIQSNFHEKCQFL